MISLHKLFSLPTRFTIILIALCAGSITANGQNTLNSTTSERAAEQVERERIQRERQGLLQGLEQKKKACYQKLAVTPCLNEARDQHGEQMRDLKRQEVALNTVQRKRDASERLRTIDQRHSPQAQLAQAQRRGRALEQAKQRESSAAEKQRNRAAKQAASAAAPASPQKSAEAATSVATPPLPQGKPRAARSTSNAASKQSRDAEKAERARQQAIQRERDAADRKAQAAAREAKRKKPGAALPVPAI